MLLHKHLIVLVTTAALASAAPNLRRQDASYGSCFDTCMSAINNLAPYCHGKSEEECRQACDVDTFLMPLNDCGGCLAQDPDSNDAAKSLVQGWMDAMVNTCRTPEKTMYGSCAGCDSAVNNLAPYCHGKSAEECQQACTVSPHLFFSAQV